MRLHGREVTRLDLERHAGDIAAVGGVRAFTLAEGVERGLRALEFRTGGGLRFEVLVDRAMDIAVAEFRGVTFDWRSPTGFRHPSLHENADEDGLSWLRSMSGLLVTAGLDHTLGGREVSAARYGYPARHTVRHGLHGRIANIPARLTGSGEIWTGDECLLWAEGEIRQVAVFGEHLVLQRRIEADLGGKEIRLLDSVSNAGFDPTPHRYLYHVNLGWPFLDAGTRVVAEAATLRWQNEAAAHDAVPATTFLDPIDGFVERCYEYTIAPGPDGRSRVRVVNDALDLSFELEFDPLAFGTFIEWVNLHAGSYAIALEPSTHGVASLSAPVEESAHELGHGEERTYRTVFRFGSS
jgi:hypothetical protein